MAGPGLVDATSALATVPMATGPQWEAPPRAPFTGMQWTVGLIGLFAYLFVIHQGVAPIGEVAVLTAAAGVFLGGGRVRLPREVAIFAVFVSIAGFSILGSDFLQKSLDTWLDYLKLWLIFFVACNLVRTPAQLRTLILVWLLFFALYPMRGSLLNYAAGISHNGRVAWNFTFNNPNDLAGLCIFPATMAAGLLVTERRGPIWFGALLQFLALFAVVFITQSRGGIVALGVAVILMIFSNRPKGKTLLLYAVVAVVIAVFTPKQTWERVGGLAKLSEAEDGKGVDAEGSAEQRLAIWKVARVIISDHPILGVGIGAYSRNHLKYARSPDLPFTARGARDTHSTYLNATAETGFVGLAVLVTLWVTVLVQSGRTVKKLRAWSPPLAAQLQFLRFGFVGFLVGGIWGSYEKMAFMYLYMALMYLFGSVYGPMALAAQGAVPSAPVPSGGGRRTGRLVS